LAKKPLNSAYPKKLVTLGDHLRKRRLDLVLFQKDVAMAIGVDSCTITNWEKGHSEPGLRFIPRVIEFLGYEPPSPPASTLGERIKQYRYERGISQKELASQIGVDPATIGRMERSNRSRFNSVLRKVTAFLQGAIRLQV